MRAAGIMLIFLALTTWAAPADALGFKLGAQVYGVRNSLTGSLPETGSWEARIAPGAGLVAELDVAPDIAISFQPGYMPRHSRQVFKEDGQVIGQVDYDFNYFSLPLLVRVTGDPVGVRGFVTAGLDLSILIDATYTGDSNQIAGEPVDVDMKDGLDPTTIGALLGAGVMVPLGRNFLAFELRYQQGLNDIIARDGSDPEPGLAGSSIKFRGLELIAGFMFAFGGK